MKTCGILVEKIVSKAHVIQMIRRYTCVYEWKIQYHKYSFPLLVCKFTVVPFKSQEVKENLVYQVPRHIL